MVLWLVAEKVRHERRRHFLLYFVWASLTGWASERLIRGQYITQCVLSSNNIVWYYYFFY